MKIFTTGSTGYIGSAVTRALAARGHQITALVRDQSDASALEDMNITVERGGIQRLSESSALLDEHDTAIHMAADHGEDPIAADLQAIDGLLAGRNDRHVIYTSGVWVFGATGDEVADEASPLDPLPIVYWRPGHESLVTDMSREGVTGAVIRPGCVYGRGESLLTPYFEAIDRGEELVIAGDGENHWAMIHVDDLAALYVAVAEQRLAGILHGTDDTHMTMNEIAHALARPTASEPAISHRPRVEVLQDMGGFGEALTVDQRVSSELTRVRTGWSPAIESLGAVVPRLWEEWREASGSSGS